MGSGFSRLLRPPGVYWSSLAIVLGITVIAIKMRSAIKRRRSAKAIKAKEGADLYETNLLVDQYLAFHYCPPAEYMKYIFGPRNSLDFPKRCVDVCIKHKPVNSLNRALDIGCAVGRSTFELAREYDEVVGIDYSNAFVSKCNELKEHGLSEYSLVVEGDLAEKKMATVDPSIDRSRVSFMVGDACDLPRDLGQFGLVFGGNLICRLPEPVAFFNRLPDLVVPGGLLVLTSPYTWLESYTDKSKWLGGFKRDGGEVRGFDTLKRLLEDSFELLANEDMAFVIRDTIRKHQWVASHVTVWKRKGQ